jgi:flagellar motor switch protein FliG
MSFENPAELNGLEKASMLLLALGTSTSAEVFKHLSEEEIERLSGGIMKIRKADPDTVDVVLNEFERSWVPESKDAVDGKDFASRVLEQVVGKQRAGELIEKAAVPAEDRPFQFLCGVDPAVIAGALAGEPAQIIAVILSNLSPGIAADVLQFMDPALQAQVAIRICSTKDVSPDVIHAMEDAMRAAMTASKRRMKTSGGPKALVEILNRAGRSTEKQVLEALRDNDPSTGKKVRSMMFVFEDIAGLDDRSIQAILRSIDQETLRLAIKGADDQVKGLLFRNMSQRSVETMMEDLELMSHVRIKEIEAAQQKIANIARRLLMSGHIGRPDEEDEPIWGA